MCAQMWIQRVAVLTENVHSSKHYIHINRIALNHRHPDHSHAETAQQTLTHSPHLPQKCFSNKFDPLVFIFVHFAFRVCSPISPIHSIELDPKPEMEPLKKAEQKTNAQWPSPAIINQTWCNPNRAFHIFRTINFYWATHPGDSASVRVNGP